MEDRQILETFISTLKTKVGEAAYRIAELETLLFLEQEKNKQLTTEIEELKQPEASSEKSTKSTNKE